MLNRFFFAQLFLLLLSKKKEIVEPRNNYRKGFF